MFSRFLAAGVLKDFLRELPEPLFTNALYQMLLDALSVRMPGDPDGSAKLMLSILECLPKANQVSRAGGVGGWVGGWEVEWVGGGGGWEVEWVGEWGREVWCRDLHGNVWFGGGVWERLDAWVYVMRWKSVRQGVARCS